MNGVMQAMPMKSVSQKIIRRKRPWRETIHKSSIKISNYQPDNGDQRIKKRILAGLRCPSKMISSIFFYDNTGSKLFEEITKLPEYYLTRTEIPLIKEAASHLSDKLRDIDIVEFGSGDCTKISILFDFAPVEFQNTICYIPFDISRTAIERTTQILHTKFPAIKIQGIVADFMSQLDVIPKQSKKIFCFLGSTIGNLEMETAQRFLENLSDTMHPGDILLIGFDMVKNKKILEKAYNDKKRITEKFNKNILNVVNNQIGTNFDANTFEHIAFYNDQQSRIEMHLKALQDLEISCPCSSSNIVIKKGETIHTENSYKYTDEDIKQLASGAGLEIQHMYTDPKKWFSLIQLIKN